MTINRNNEYAMWTLIFLAFAQADDILADEAKGKKAAATKIAEPAAVPMPSPSRKTARTMDSVYVVEPSMRPNSLVHRTSAPSAQKPESPMTT